MIHINGKADQNDIDKVLMHNKLEDIVAVQPCPRGDENKINPHVTKFMLKNGQNVSIFHVKPIYYETKDGAWRPMEEVTLGFGNTWIDFKGDWADKMHVRYMSWLQKRMDLLHKPKGINIAVKTPYGAPITVEQKELVIINR